MYIPPLPLPRGHYSPAVVHSGIVYLSGQLPAVAGGSPVSDTIEAQTAECMQQVRTLLQACGSDLSCLLKVNIYIADIELWPRVNAEYARIMGEHRPARAIIPCGKLHYGCLIEIDGIATVLQDANLPERYV